MRSKNLMVVSLVAAVVALAVFATVAYGVYAGLTDGRKKALTPDAVVVGHAPAVAVAQNGASADALTGTSTSAAAPTLGIAQPAPGAFSPGSPPFGGPGGVSSDGLSAWGVAYREVTDPGAQADSALVKAAYLDAEKKATDLATATGNRLGKLLALTDYSADQPYFKPCVQNYIPPQGAPVPAPGKPQATSAAPCQASGNRYLVVWVYVRHAL